MAEEINHGGKYLQQRRDQQRGEHPRSKKHEKILPLLPPLLPPGGASPGGRACMLPHPLHLRGVDMAEHYGGITPVLYINKTNDKDVVRDDQEVF